MAATPSAVAAPEVEPAIPESPPAITAVEPEPTEQHFTIKYGDTGHSHDSILGPYLPGAKEVLIEDPSIRLPHQIPNFVRFCETVVKYGTVRKIALTINSDDGLQHTDALEKSGELRRSVIELEVELDVKYNPASHDREIRVDKGRVIKIGRGLDFYQKPGS